MNTKYVTSIKLSQQLAKARVRQESEFYWEVVIDNYNVEPILIKGKRNEHNGEYEENDIFEVKYYSAFLACELMEMLPKTIEKETKYDKRNWLKEAFELTDKERKEGLPIGNLIIIKPTDYIVLYEGYMIFGNDVKARTHDKTLPNALAKMLLYLIEQGVVKI